MTTTVCPIWTSLTVGALCGDVMDFFIYFFHFVKKKKEKRKTTIFQPFPFFFRLDQQLLRLCALGKTSVHFFFIFLGFFPHSFFFFFLFFFWRLTFWTTSVISSLHFGISSTAWSRFLALWHDCWSCTWSLSWKGSLGTTSWFCFWQLSQLWLWLWWQQAWWLTRGVPGLLEEILQRLTTTAAI